VTAPYESTGRTRQKTRTRTLLVATVRELIAQGITPTVEDVAEASGVSRTTTYRYFPNQRALLLAAHPEIERTSLVPDSVTDVRERLEVVLDEHFRILVDWEPQLRTSLRLSLEPSADQPPLRGGRALLWIEDALTPLGQPTARHLAIAIRAAAGIEPYIWLTDIAGQPQNQALATMRTTARTILEAALASPPGRPRDRPGAASALQQRWH
jgi:AcrR family transcriptional regulator